MRCPYCHNLDLVLNPHKLPEIEDNKAIAYLQSKRHLYDAVCITGGEPTMEPSLIETLTRLKESEFKIKLDTNGTNFECVKYVVDESLVDYIALDIKGTWESYKKVFSGLKQAEKLIPEVQKTLNYLLREANIDYELRSTVYPPYFTEIDIPQIQDMVKGAKRYFLQQFRPEKTLAECTSIIPFSSIALKEIAEQFCATGVQCEVRC